MIPIVLCFKEKEDGTISKYQIQSGITKIIMTDLLHHCLPTPQLLVVDVAE